MVTKRDMVWSAALQRSAAGEAFTAWDLYTYMDISNRPSKRMVRDTLTSMVDLDHLAAEGGEGSSSKEFKNPEVSNQ